VNCEADHLSVLTIGVAALNGDLIATGGVNRVDIFPWSHCNGNTLDLVDVGGAQ